MRKTSLFSVWMSPKRAHALSNALTTVEDEGCGLRATSLAQTHEVVACNGQQSELTFTEMWN